MRKNIRQDFFYPFPFYTIHDPSGPLGLTPIILQRYTFSFICNFQSRYTFPIHTPFYHPVTYRKYITLTHDIQIGPIITMHIQNIQKANPT